MQQGMHCRDRRSREQKNQEEQKPHANHVEMIHWQGGRRQIMGKT